MKMHKIIFLIIFVNLANINYAEETDINISDYSNKINNLLINIKNTIMKNNITGNVINTYNVAENALKNNLVTFKIDTDLDKILNGMVFRYYHDTEEISLFFGKYFLDTFTENSTIHYSVLMHEFKHLHDYMNNKNDFLSAMDNEKEKYWYELDALHIEAEFIKYYLYGTYELSNFENYLLNSFNDNNLDSISIINERESMVTFFYFNRMEEAYRNNNNKKEELLRDIIDRGNNNIKKYENDDPSNQFNYFADYIVLSTFRKYMLQFMALIINNPTTTWGEVFEQYPSIGNIYNKITEIQSNDSKMHNKYLHTIYDYWENDFSNRFNRQ
ncbi:hypothetical protein LQZ19_16255 [Treponema primitia]|uniref:hypothetical protein n=1 Tax=Treponema primitia TaxID=88058 RepID=UPI00397FFC2F